MEICGCFSLKLTYDQTAEQTKTSPPTIHEWFSYFRELCLESLNTGGTGGHQQENFPEHFAEFVFFKRNQNVVMSLVSEMTKKYNNN